MCCLTAHVAHVSVSCNSEWVFASRTSLLRISLPRLAELHSLHHSFFPSLLYLLPKSSLHSVLYSLSRFLLFKYPDSVVDLEEF